jgi:hypothetical protein
MSSAAQGNLSVEGIVRDPTGLPLGGGLVVLLKSGDALQWTITDELGRYRFKALMAGTHQLVIPGPPDFVTLKRSIELTAPIQQDEILSVRSISTCVCVSLAEDPAIQERLNAAMSQLRQVTLRVEDLQPDASLDEERRKILDDLRYAGPRAVYELEMALHSDPRMQVRRNALVVLLGLSWGTAEQKPVDISGALNSVAGALRDSDSTINAYALMVLQGALK